MRRLRITGERGFATLGFEVLEALPGADQHRGLAGISLPAVDHDVDIARLDFDQTAAASGALGRNQGRTRAAKWIEHDAVAVRAILDRISHQRYRLDGRVHRNFFAAPALHGRATRIVPHIAAHAPVLVEFEIVDVRCGAVLPHEHQLVTAAVESAHPRIGLGPDADIFELGICRTAGHRHLAKMAPINADVMQRPVGSVRHQLLEHGFQERNELALGHLPARHREFTIIVAILAAGVTVNFNIVGWIGEDKLGLFILQKLRVDLGVTRIPANKAMAAELPYITQANSPERPVTPPARCPPGLPVHAWAQLLDRARGRFHQA